MRTPATEVPRRAEAIRSALERLGATFGGDPEAPLAVTPVGFRAAGGALRALGVPTVLVHDGGHDLTTIGVPVCERLAGAQAGPARA